MRRKDGGGGGGKLAAPDDAMSHNAPQSIATALPQLACSRSRSCGAVRTLGGGGARGGGGTRCYRISAPAAHPHDPCDATPPIPPCGDLSPEFSPSASLSDVVVVCRKAHALRSVVTSLSLGCGSSPISLGGGRHIGARRAALCRKLPEAERRLLTAKIGIKYIMNNKAFYIFSFSQKPNRTRYCTVAWTNLRSCTGDRRAARPPGTAPGRAAPGLRGTAMPR